MIRPSNDWAILAMIQGIPVVIHLLKPTFSRPASSSSTPVLTAIPARRSLVEPAPLMFWIRVDRANHHSRDFCSDDCICARRGSPDRRTWFQRHIERCTCGRLGSWQCGQGFDFGMRTSCAPMPAGR